MVALLLFFVCLFIVFSIPAVQTALAGKLTEILQQRSDVRISVERVSLSYFGKVKLDEILVEDHHRDTLISIEELRTSILGLSNILQNEPELGNTTLENLRFNIKHYKGEALNNLDVLLEKLEGEAIGDKEKSTFRLGIKDIIILDSYFSFIDERNTNPEILVLDKLNLQARNLLVEGDKISVDIESLNANEGRGLKIEDLQSDIAYSPLKLTADNLLLKTAHSEIDANIQLDYSPGDFSDFVNRVQISANFSESQISTNDLKVFYEAFGEDLKMEISTELTGTLNDFRLNNLDLSGLDRSKLIGDVAIKGAFSKDSDDFELKGQFRELSSNYYDLVNLLPSVLRGNLPVILQEFGNLKLEGAARVTTNALDANVNINSQLGSAKADITLTNISSSANAAYNGNLVFNNFNLGKFLDNKNLGKTSFNLNIDGKGFTRENLNTRIRGKISRLYFKNYGYTNVAVLGNLQNSVFNGDLVSNDPNLKLEFKGLVDMSKAENIYDFEAAVGYADLNALNLFSRDSISVFKGDIIMNMQGTNIDNASGKILLLNTTYKNQNDLYYFDDLRLTSSFNEEGIRSIAINAPDIIEGEISGKFRLSEIDALIENSIGSIYTNYRPNTITTNQYLEFDFNIYNKIVEILYPEVALAPNTFMRGRIESDESEFRLSFRSPKIEAFGNMLKDVNLQVDNTNPLYNTFVEADSISTEYYNFSEFNLINVTLRDTLFIRSEFQGGKNNNDVFNLNLFHTINQDNKSVVGIQRSDVKFKEHVWYLNEKSDKSNKIIFDKNFRNLEVDSLVLSHREEAIRLSGKLRDSTYKNFQMEFDQVDLAKVTPEISNLDLAGILDGKLRLLQEAGIYYPRTSLGVMDLTVNQKRLGNLQVDIDSNEDLTFYNIDASLKNKGFESLSAEGGIDVRGGAPVIDMYLALRKFNMEAFSALGGEALDNIRGLVSGDARVTGNYQNPDIDGSLELNNAGFRIPYLNIDFDLEDQASVKLTRQQFNFENINVTDTKFRTSGVIDGTISHNNFEEWFLDLNVSSNRLLVLDTKATEDALYYGTGFIDGGANIYGPTDDLTIDVNARTQKGTVFIIPLSETESIGDNSFIHFLSPEEKAARRAGEAIRYTDIKGLKLNFDLDITNDAEVEVVVDKASGSSLRGRGAGNLLIEINTNGKFNMWGDFLVYQGVYNFKYAGLVQKNFKVRPGSSINWDGNPARAQLDVNAVYSVEANPSVLLENPSINRKIPVDVVILLQGELVQPDITFNVEFPNVSSVVRSELEYRISDRANRELQALSLVTQGQFYNEFTLGTSAITGTLVERASSLVNDIFADEDGKFQVGVNYTQGDRRPDQQAIDRLGLTLSTKISDRILINGQVGVPVGGVSETVIVGDVEIQFLLNEDGSLRAKVFNRESNIQFIGEEIGFTQGVGLSYSVDFDTFRELLRKIMASEAAKSPTLSRQGRTRSPAPDYIVFPKQ